MQNSGPVRVHALSRPRSSPPFGSHVRTSECSKRPSGKVSDCVSVRHSAPGKRRFALSHVPQLALSPHTGGCYVCFNMKKSFASLALILTLAGGADAGNSGFCPKQRHHLQKD